MHVFVLILAWITPAAIAGAMGWSGIWGTGSAFAEYLIPVPVAGGVFHVPSFVIAAGVILACRNSTEGLLRYLPVIGFSVLAASLSLMLEFDRLHAWMFTDYVPAGSPLRLDGNPLLLFVATDAFWVALYGLMRGCASPARAWLAVPVVPAVIVAFSVVSYKTGGPVFEAGLPMPTTVRGEKSVMVFTSENYDEDLFVNWVKQDYSFAHPWSDTNAEHVAVFFTNSLQAIKRARIDQAESDCTIATICLYEEDRSITPHGGYHDCFADHLTVDEELAALAAANPTGLGSDIDFWYARLLLCDAVGLPEPVDSDLARPYLCHSMARDQARFAKRFIDKYGEGSAQVEFINAQVASRQ